MVMSSYRHTFKKNSIGFIRVTTRLLFLGSDFFSDLKKAIYKLPKMSAFEVCLDIDVLSRILTFCVHIFALL